MRVVPTWPDASITQTVLEVWLKESDAGAIIEREREREKYFWV